MSAEHGAPIDISIVVPLHDEEENVTPLYERITASVSGMGMAYEILFVNDGSRDRTLDIAGSLALRDPHLKVIDLLTNFGQTPAMAVGIARAQGRFVVTMDGDLQNDPADIPAMLNALTDDFDMVVGWRKNRRDLLITRKIPSWIANRLIGWITGVHIRDNGCSLRIYRADVIKRLPLYSEMHRFIPVLAMVAGARVKEVVVRHHERRFGHSKYGLSRIYKVLLDVLALKMVMSFSERPLMWFGSLALPAALLGIALMLAGIWPLVLAGGDMSLPFVGTGILLLTLAIMLWMGGLLGELVYYTGDMDLSQFTGVTAMRLCSQVEIVRADDHVA
jgi:glycosyltransferase involved in cell wall biosynthesis